MAAARVREVRLRYFGPEMLLNLRVRVCNEAGEIELQTFQQWIRLGDTLTVEDDLTCGEAAGGPA